jgi:DNA-binding transcriptional LysR family regulator
MIRILEDWHGPVNNIDAAYLSRRGLSKSGRAFLDFLVDELPPGDI